jgi:phage terminase small subunit
MPKRLSKKQKGFIKDYIATGNGVQSALKNYDTDDYNSANQIAIENLQKPIIQNAIKSIADSIPDELLIEVHLQGLKATKKVVIEQEEIDEEPDYATRHKYLDTSYKIKGSYSPEKIKLSGVIGHGNLEQLSNEELLNIINGEEPSEN